MRLKFDDVQGGSFIKEKLMKEKLQDYIGEEVVRKIGIYFWYAFERLKNISNDEIITTLQKYDGKDIWEECMKLFNKKVNPENLLHFKNDFQTLV